MKEKMVRIEWVDSCTDGGWKNREYAKEEACLSQCESVGFLFKKTKTDITIVQSRSNTTKSVSEMMTIPKKCITKIVELKGD